MKENNFIVENNPNQKLTSEQLSVINDYLDKEKNTTNVSIDDKKNTLLGDTNDFLEDEESTFEKKSDTLFKTYGFIDPSKLSLRSNNKKTPDTNFKKQNNNLNNRRKELKNSNLKFKKNSENKNTQDVNEKKSDIDDEKNTNRDLENNNFSKKKTFNNVRSLKEIKDEIRKYKQIKAEKVSKRLGKKRDEDSKNNNKISVPVFTTLETMSALLRVDIDELLKRCKSYGLRNILPQQKLDKDSISILADDFGYIVEFQEDLLNDKFSATNKESTKTRVPIVTVMGHVDHGKTTFLDYIRKTHVTKSEKGGITQHLGAYKIKASNGREIVFLDTPGHEAFTNMRSVGCDVSDVVIIIIAADDGVKKQTKEALSEANNANVPVVFAFNKIDKEGININKIKEELSTMNFLVEDWGGRYQYQEISAKTGAGIDELLEKVFIEADLLDLEARFSGPAVGTVIESSLEKGIGYLNNVIVRDGKLEVGDFVVIGSTYGKVRMLINDKGEKVKASFPSDPVQIVGLNSPAVSGEKFYVVKDEKEAKKTVSEIENLLKQQKSSIANTNSDGEKLNFIVKSDVVGTAKAISDSLKKLKDDIIDISVINYGVGNVTENDVLLAETSKSIIVTFNLKNPSSIVQFAKNKSIQIISCDIIYDILDKVSEIIKKIKHKNKVEKYVGKTEIKAIFDISKVGKIAGCVVVEGPVFKKNLIKVIRGGDVIFIGEIKTIKHKKDEIESVKTMDECGICIKNFENFKVGDFIEFYDLVDGE